MQWLSRQQTSPNLTSLSMIGIPKGAGQKGGVPKNSRKRKRGSGAAAKTSVDRLSAEATAPTSGASGHTTTTIQGQQINMQGQQINVQGHESYAWLPSNYVSSMPSQSTSWPSQLPSQSSSWPVQSGSWPVQSSSWPVQSSAWPSQSTWPCYPFYSPMSSPVLPTGGYSMYPPSLPPNTSTPGKSNPVVSPYPFTLKKLTARIQICQGCRIPFRRERLSVQEPYDLVVARLECRPYRAAGGETMTPSQPSNSHYHVSLQCIRSAEPTFSPVTLVIPDDVHSSLSEAHKQFINSALGICV